MSDDSSEKKDKKKSRTTFADFLGFKRREVTEETILDMIDEGEENGNIEEHERDRIENILDFTDREVSDIMTHRIDIAALEDTADLNETVRLAIDTGYSRIPVYHDDIDYIIGVLYVKDLLRYVIDRNETFCLKDIVRNVPFVPRNKNCEKLFAMMTEQKVQMAVIVDEYGGTEGLVGKLLRTEFLISFAAGVGLVEQSQTVFHAQDAAHGIVNSLHRHLALVHQFLQQDAEVDTVGVHTHVDTCVDSNADGVFLVFGHMFTGVEVVNVGPVGHQHAVPLQVFLQPLR